MAQRKSMRTKTWSLEMTTFPLKLCQNGRGAKASSGSQGPYEPRIKTIWKVESLKNMVYS